MRSIVNMLTKINWKIIVKTMAFYDTVNTAMCRNWNVLLFGRHVFRQGFRFFVIYKVNIFIYILSINKNSYISAYKCQYTLHNVLLPDYIL